MTSDECYAFIQEEGIEIPEQLKQIPTIKAYIREILITLENNPTFNFIINYTVTKSLVDDIQSWYLKTYGSNLKLLRSTSVNVLDDSLVYDNGEWKNTGGDWNPIYRDYNCYAYALNITDNKFNPGEIYNSTSTLSLYEERLEGIATLTENDIISLGYTNVRVLDYFPNEITENMNVICLRVSDFDFHYMKYDYYTNSWYHKPGDSAVLKYNSVMDNANIWKNEGSLEGNIIKPTQYDDTLIYYNSNIKYIIYEDNEVGINCVDKILQTTENILPNKRLIKRVNLDCPNNLNILISSNSNFDVKIYDSILNTYMDDFTFLSNTRVDFSSDLNFGTYIIYVFNSSLENSLELDIDYEVNYQNSIELLDFGENNILNDLHLNYENKCEIIKCLVNQNGPGFYKFTLDAEIIGGNVTYPEGAITIKDHLNEEIEYKYNVFNNSEQAKNDFGIQEMYVYLPRNGYFYIHIKMPNEEYSKMDLIISEAVEEDINIEGTYDVEYSHVLFDENERGDYAKKITINQTTQFNLKFEVEEEAVEDIIVIIFREVYNSNTHTYQKIDKFSTNINCDTNQEEYEISLEQGTYYIGYFGNTDGIQISATIYREVYGDNITTAMVADPGFGYTYGSEVRFNEGEFGGTTITEGFTRNLHFISDGYVPSFSRLDYNFYSSNNSVATVSQYGTVLAKPVEEDVEVTITAVYKENPSYIFTKTFIIKNEVKNTMINIEFDLTYSYSSNNGKYSLTLNETNCPYPWIQSYDWSVEVSEQSNLLTVNISQFGTITSSGSGSAIITGHYQLNERVHIIINLTITE